MLGSLDQLSETQGTRLRADPLFYFALAACLGILLADTIHKAALFGAAFVVLTIAFCISYRTHWHARLIWPLMVLAFASTHAWHREAFLQFPLRQIIETDSLGVHVHATGRIETEPRKLGNFGQQAVVQLDNVTARNTTYHSPHKILIRSFDQPISYGDHIQFSGRLHLPESPRNPGQFDYRTFLQRHDWLGIVEVTRSEHFEILSQQPHPFIAVAHQARARMARAITKDIENEPDICAVLTAMVLGMREQATPELERPFQFSGTLHLFAVSGLHVGIFALIAWLLLKPWGLSRAQVSLLLIPLLFSYAFITGWRPSAVRAATMATVFLAGFCLHREPRLLNSLGLAALLILAADTNQLFLPGFQLSFAVLLSIISLTKVFQRPFRRWLYPDPFLPTSLLEEHELRAYAMRRWLGDIVSVSAAAWLGSLPLMAATFHLVTPVAIVANCLLMPLGFVILLTAAMSMLTSLISLLGPLNILFNNANFVLVHGLLFLAESFSRVPGGHFLVSTRLPFTRPPTEVTVLDLPKGSACTHVSIRGGPDELLDIGHRLDYPLLTEPYLHHVGLNQIDRLWLSHGDTSHTSAAPLLLDSYHPKVYQTTWPVESPSLREVARLLQRNGTEPIRLERGQSVPIKRGAHWEILHPPASTRFAPGAADDRCLILRLHAEGWRLLFISDAGFATERWLLDSGQDLSAEVLIKGNHAADVSGMTEFLNAVRPRAIIIDSENDLNAPAWEWARTHEAVLIDQQEAGAVILGIHKERLKLQGFRQAQPTFLKRAR